jgi:hypothetical protein
MNPRPAAEKPEAPRWGFWRILVAARLYLINRDGMVTIALTLRDLVLDPLLTRWGSGGA